MKNDYQIIELSFEESIAHNFEIPPRERHMGMETGAGTIMNEKISIRVGNFPIVYNLKKLYEISGKSIPPEIQIFTSYDVWIVNYSIGVMKTRGMDGIKQIGFKVNYKLPAFVNILETMPKTEFIKLIDGKLTFMADLGINGSIQPPDIGIGFTGAEKLIGVGGKLDLSTDNSIVGRFDFSVVSPLIMSVGIGSNSSEWVMNKGENPLYGDDLLFTNIVMVEKHTNKIELEAIVYATISVYNLIPSRRSSKLMNLTIELKN